MRGYSNIKNKRSLTLMVTVLSATLLALGRSPSTCQAATDQEPGNINWSTVNTWISFYLVDPDMKGYYASTKALEATTSLIDGHCKTGYGTKLKHHHLEGDFTGQYLADANRYWNWYYDQVSGIARLTNATNKTNCLCYAMDGYASGANHDYWVNPGIADDQMGDAMFVDDCDIRSYGPPPNSLFAQTNDRLTYVEQEEFSYLDHATIVDSVSNEIPTEIRWKNGYSGAYEWDVPSDEPDDDYAFSTPGSYVWQCIGSSPFKVYDRHYYGYWRVVVFYERD